MNQARVGKEQLINYLEKLGQTRPILEYSRNCLWYVRDRWLLSLRTRGGQMRSQINWKRAIIVSIKKKKEWGGKQDLGGKGLNQSNLNT